MASTELPRLRGSINALKGHLTRTLDRVDKFLIHSVNETTRDSALSFQNEITKKHEMLEEAVLAASSISEEEYDVQWEGMVKYEERVASVRASIAKLLTDLNQSASESLLNTSTSSTAASSGSAGKRPFDVNLLRPFLLTPEHAPADFRSWKEEFASFYSGYGMEHHPLEQQQALFRKCISSEFWEHIRLQIHVSLPVYSATSGPSCLRVLEDTFWHLYPAFTRRLEYEETGPETGESPLAFLKRLVQLFEDSSIVEVDEKDRLVFKFLSRYPDPWIRGRIMELKTPVFSDLWRIAEAREKQIFADASLTKIAQRKLAMHSPSPVATVQAALLDGSCATANEVAVAAAVNPPRPQRKTGKHKAVKSTPPPSSSKRCSKCGTAHKPENSCFIDARDLVCAGCGKHGHARRACSSVTVRSIATAGATATRTAMVPRHYPEDVSSDDDFFSNLEVHPKVTPLLKVRVHHAKGRFLHPSFPDSGSAISLASSELASRFGVEVSKTPASLPQLTAVNGDPLRVDGVARLRIGIPHSGKSIRTVVVVSPDVKEGLLIGYPDLRNLGVVSKDFPSPPSFICQRCHRGFVGKEDGGACDFGRSVSSDHRRSVSSDKVHLKANNWCSDSSVYSSKVTGHAKNNSHKLSSEVEKGAIGRGFPHESESATRHGMCSFSKRHGMCSGGGKRHGMCVTANRHGKCECHVNQIVNGKKLTEMALDLKTQLLHEFKDVISDTLPEKPACGKPMKIHLKAGTITPTKVLTARKVPLHWEGPARRVIDKALADGIITKVDGPTDWISPAFFVDKRVPGETCLRLVTDFTGLNKYVLRPVHPFPSSQEIISGLNPRSRVFCKMDAVQGYHQIPLDEDSSLLTTFILPWGRFRYRCAGMGLSASSDEWCRRSDKAIEGITGVRKLVDDFLVEGETVDELRQRVRRVLDNCRRFGITISERKLEIATQVKFAGFRVSAAGVVPDPSRLKAIIDFPRPGNVTALRGFVGLINQLNIFTPEVAMKTNPFRGLLKKGAAFQWLPEHEAAFVDAKRSLVHHVRLHHFDRSLRTCLVTDASRLHGLGFMLVQLGPLGELRHVIQCGSRSLKPAEANYATIELECLAIQWAVEKCQYFLRGCGDFSIQTDHRPLIGVFQKPLGEVANPRIFRFREKLLPYSFDVSWLPGKKNLIADALSRNPCDVDQDGNKVTDNCASDTGIGVKAVVTPGTVTDRIRNVAASCAEYQAVNQAFDSGVAPSDLPDGHPARSLGGVWSAISRIDGLLCVDGHRILVPRDARSSIVALLHKSHCGLVKTYATAREHYFWPAMKNDLKTAIDKCEVCQSSRPSLPVDTFITTTSEEPMAQVSVDLFQVGNSHYLLLVDRYSGYPMVTKLKSLTSETVIQRLNHWFLSFGYPRVLRSDGGPQFRSRFAKFCSDNGIRHEVSSPYNSQSNGHAEAGVKNVKGLIVKVSTSGFDDAFFAWRNTVRSDGVASPAELFFKRRLRGAWPMVDQAPPPSLHHQGSPHKKIQSKKVSDCSDLKLQPRADKLRPLSVGDVVRIQDNGRWSLCGVVVGISNTNRSYSVKTEDGRTIHRNRRFLKPKL